ncbi:hypothetical protein F5Y18DRAFT_382971 [Xylariaceae sp. FL1019]|nr:hypothetical protein F5Y18DRAFT_382971 [Xylariaceae sp. FL1019]
MSAEAIALAADPCALAPSAAGHEHMDVDVAVDVAAEGDASLLNDDLPQPYDSACHDDSSTRAGIKVTCPPLPLNHDTPPDDEQDHPHSHHLSPKPTGLHSPPDSNNAMKLDGSDSELSDIEDPTLEPDQLPSVHSHSQPYIQPEPIPTAKTEPEEEEDIGEVTPDHWSGTVPVFKPDMHQFKDFKKFMAKIDSYGMKSGIVKVVPPDEWKDKLPQLDELVKQVRVREPIKQEIMGSNGTYRQVNILHGRAYNLPQWRQLCDQSEHQPPARRGERRAQAPPKPKASAAPKSAAPRRTAASAVGQRRTTRSRNKKGGAKGNAADQDERPMTPVSPKPADDVFESVEQDPGTDVDVDEEDDAPRPVGRMGGSRQAKPKQPKEQSTSARRKFARREGSARIDEEAFKDFDYHMDISDYTPERCEELERIYWKTLTYAPPLYGADVLGTLFDDSTDKWNLNKLPNLLDVLGSKVPGVNTAYLYLGMWKATFAWHLEDVDLYSINYLHFGAPKQWYSISQGDARRFEAAMKSIWPTDAKACDQFLRHKAFLISPNHLQQYFNIKVNKCVSYPGEFVVTYPYGYHSGYNLGYNCAEAVNFALDSWLPMGKIAKKCECAQAQDSVWIDVHAIERKLRGEETDYEETEDEEDEDEEDEDEETGIPTPRSSHIRFKVPGGKRKRAATDKGERKAKKIRLRIKSHVEPPCCLCPHDIAGAELLPTDDKRKAHRLCAIYGAETWIETVDGKETVANVANISKARLDLKCLFCRSKRGACLQCSHKKCVRSYHATCAAAAGMFVEEAEIPIFSEEGVEYKEQAFAFTCRFHRAKRDRKLDTNNFDDHKQTAEAAIKILKGDISQFQYFSRDVIKKGGAEQFQYSKGEIFAGIVVENRVDEHTFLVDILPNGYVNLKRLNEAALLTYHRERVEVEWKWLVLEDPTDLHLPHASAQAIPMPTSRKAKEQINANRKQVEELPRADDVFVEGGFTWAEFNHHDLEGNRAQVKIDMSKENQVWHYLGRFSTEARPQYTEDPKKQLHNCKSNFLDTIPRPPPPPPQPRKSTGAAFSIRKPPAPVPAPKQEKPYQYKPRDPIQVTPIRSPFTAQQFTPASLPPYTHQQFAPTGAPYTNTFFHHTSSQPTTKPAKTSASPQTPSTSAPYYNFSQAPALPAQQTSQSQQQFHPSVKFPQPPQQQATNPPKPLSQSTYQPNQPILQVAPQPSQHSAFHYGQQSQAAQQSAAKKTPTAPTYTLPQPVPSGVNKLPTTPATHAGSRRPSLPRPVPPASGSHHARNKSSVSSLSGRYGLGSGQRMGTPPASYGHSRTGSMTQSPFSHGFSQPKGLESPQNGQMFQSQARARSSSLASNISLKAPMTSSSIRPNSSTSAQKLASHLQSVISSTATNDPPQDFAHKYPFFQVNCNRDSAQYRTPYAPWGGFTNGYEGNLRAHLMQTPDALFALRRQSTGPNGTTSGLSAASQNYDGNTQFSVESDSFQTQLSPSAALNSGRLVSLPLGYNPSRNQAFSPSTAAPMSRGLSNERKPSFGSSYHWDGNSDASPGLHPAIRARYASMLQRQDLKTEEPFGNSNILGNEQPALKIVPVITSRMPNSVSPSTPIQHVTPTVPPQASVSRSMSVHTTSSSKSSTPIPPPLIPSSSGPVGSVSAKLNAVVPKQTHIPAPRPWETLRKVSLPTPHSASRPAPSTPVVVSPMGPTATPSMPSPSPYLPAEVSKRPPTPGMQPSHVQSAGSRLPPLQQYQSATVSLLPQAASQQSDASTACTTTAIPSATGLSASAVPRTPGDLPLLGSSDAAFYPDIPVAAETSAAVAPEDAPESVFTAASLPLPEILAASAVPETSTISQSPIVTASQGLGSGDLPEVSDGSMELVESIIRNAQMASGLFSFGSG